MDSKILYAHGINLQVKHAANKGVLWTAVLFPHNEQAEETCGLP